jgi:hypothetical protein
MIDAEVIRLRRLRDTVLRARAMAKVLNSHSGMLNSVFSRAAVDCWRIARVLTGKLRSHPYLAYQRGPGVTRTICDYMSTLLLGSLAVKGGRQWRTFARELQRVSRELDDVRSLTWSSELIDALGRSQTQIRMLLEEVDAAARKECGSSHQPARMDAPIMVGGGDDSGRNEQWPYLAI